MKRTILTRNNWVSATLVALFVSILAVPPATAQASQSTEFSWSAELVSLDEPGRTVTVKARVVGDQAQTSLGRFKPGEKITLGWSGYDRYADAVNRAAAAGAKGEDRFAFPVEFVSYDSTRQYVTFKVQLPTDGAAKLKALKPGEWITATSPHGKTATTQPIAAIRPYVSSSTSN